MADLLPGTGLAVIGIEIFGTESKNVAYFGSQIFHGTDTVHEASQPSLSAGSLKDAVEAFLLQAGIDNGVAGVLMADPLLEEKLITSGISSKLQTIPNPQQEGAHLFAAASKWLESGELSVVLMLEAHSGDPSLAAVLVSTMEYASQTGKQVLAVIAGAACFESAQPDQQIGALVQSTLVSANLKPSEIGLLLASDTLESSPMMNSPQELIAAFPADNTISCALSGAMGGLFSVIKAIWCLHKHVIPGTARWQTPTNPEIWRNSAFYCPTESRTWFTSAQQPVRIALVCFSAQGGTASALVFREGPFVVALENTALENEAFFLFPVSGTSPQDLIQNLAVLQKELTGVPDLQLASSRRLIEYQAGSMTDGLTACILGSTKEALNREIDFAILGIPSVLEKKADWRTPGGSYFSPVPLGATGKVAFVFPGAFNSYPGLGRGLFYLFPALYGRLENISSNVGSLINEKLLYPRSISAMSAAELDEAEKKLAADPLAMLISGTSLAVVFTFLLRETFGIHPASAFGYSLGEISMLFASGVWTEADETSTALQNSPLFRTRLAGQQNTVRESWNLPTIVQAAVGQPIWENYVLMASPEETAVALQSEPRVYLTHINTPRQVVIGGDPVGCQRVITSLGCNSLQAPFDYALHCNAMVSEYNALQDLLSWPVASQPNMALFSAGSYQALPIDRKVIAQQLATGLCRTLDFPRLANHAFEDGARIFIELGAGSNCARWVDESLKDKPHVAFSINRKGLDDHAAILQLLAKLICHQVPLDLAVLTA